VLLAQFVRRPVVQAAARLTLVVAILSVLFVPFASPTAQATPAAEAVSRDPRFGLNEAWRAADAADRAGAGWSRVLFWWSEMQKDGPGDLNLFATDQDSYISSETLRGRELAGAVLNTPGWASTDGSPNGVPKGLYLAYDDPGNTWGQFMRLMAEHYRGRIDTWIIWNEVDISGGQWHTWNGSIEDYVQLQKVAYKAIKAGNPNATVLPFGAAWWYDYGATVTKMLDLLAADPDAKANNYYFDVGNLHLYSRAEDIPRIIGWYRDQLAAHGMSKPIWIAETNAIPYDDAIWQASKNNFRATMDEQASYMIQAFSTYLGLGIQRVSVNRAIDGTDFEAGGEPFGLLRNDGSQRPAFTAYQVVTRYFSGVTDGTFEHAADGTTKVVLKRGSDRITVLWSMSPDGGTATVDALGTQALRVNKWGDTAPIQADGGHFTISLAGATANSNSGDRSDYVIGGEPVILVERQDGNVLAAVRSLDENPVPGGAIEAASVGDPGSASNQTRSNSDSKSKATPTPTPKKPVPTPTPKKR
jgi:hypothetical protein